MSDLEAFAQQELTEPLRAQLIVGNTRTSIDIRSDKAGFHSVVVKSASSPAAIAEQQQSMGAATLNDTFTISFTHSRYSHKRALLAVLKSGYLLMFATLGYRFIPRFGRIRKQLLNPGEIDDGLLQLVQFSSEFPSSRRQMALLTEPDNQRSIYIGFGRWGVFLPLSPDSALYGRLSGPYQFDGIELVIPPDPPFGLTPDEILAAEARSSV